MLIDDRASTSDRRPAARAPRRATLPGPDAFEATLAWDAPSLRRSDLARRGALSAAARTIWIAHRAWLSVLATAVLAGVVLESARMVPDMLRPTRGLEYYVLALLLVPWFAALSLVWHRVQLRLPWGEAWALARRGELADARLLEFALVLVGMRLMLMTAVSYKVAMPAVHPFTHDATLMWLDRSLHGGRLPHEWLTLGAGSLRLLDAAYALWYPMLGVWIVWMAARPDSLHRRRSLLAMTLLWIGVGCGVAWLGASAGPCYFALVTPSGTLDPYAAELSRLHGLGLVATSIQDRLWQAHVAGSSDLVAGIAAFPSLHVAVPALLAVSLPRFRWPFAVLTVLTAVGAVALLWHYAVDAYAGAAGAMLCWWIAGKLTASGPAIPRT